MKYELNYIEQQLKAIKEIYPDYYNHILTGKELSDFIFQLIDRYSERSDRESVYEESVKLITGDFFRKNAKNIVFNGLKNEDSIKYRKSFEKQTEDFFLHADYDIAISRQIRYMPAQWHRSSYFIMYIPQDADCEVFLKNGETIRIRHGDLLILSPLVEHASPCYEDDAYLEQMYIRKSSFDKVFWDQLNSTSIMSRFFRNALKNEDASASSYILFRTEKDKEIFDLICRIKQEIRQNEKYSSQVINSLTSLLFSLMLRKYEDSVLLPSDSNMKWKEEFTGIFAYIQDNYKNTSIKEVASKCHYSTRQIGRIVQYYFNMTYTDLITFLKMNEAISLLNENVLSLEEISHSLGYSDLSSFCRAFKKYMKQTPTDYLNNMR